MAVTKLPPSVRFKNTMTESRIKKGCDKLFVIYKEDIETKIMVRQVLL